VLLACLLATLAFRPQDPPPAAALVERVKALIAQTNDCRGFVVRYHLRDKEDRKSDLRMAFRAPSELVIDVQSEGGRAFMRVRGDAILEVHGEKNSQAVRSASAEWSPETRYERVLRELFERQLPGALRPTDLQAGEKLLLALRYDPTGFSFNMGLGTERSARLAWLEDMQRSPERVSQGEGNELVFALAENVRMLVSAESGFVTRLEKRTDAGTRIGLELVSLEQGERPADSEFEPPDFGEAPRDASDEMELTSLGRSFLSSRSSLFGSLSRAIDDERLKWSEDSSARIETLVKAMREIDFTPFCAQLARRWQAWIEQVAGQYAKEIEGLDLGDPQTREQLAERVGSSRSALEEGMKEELRKLLARDFARTPCKRRPGLRDELLEMEQRVLPEIYTQHCSRPVLAAFDERVGKQLEAK
jgi:hypothetical protein